MNNKDKEDGSLRAWLIVVASFFICIQVCVYCISTTRRSIEFLLVGTISKKLALWWMMSTLSYKEALIRKHRRTEPVIWSKEKIGYLNWCYCYFCYLRMELDSPLESSCQISQTILELQKLQQLSYFQLWASWSRFDLKS